MKYLKTGPPLQNPIFVVKEDKNTEEGESPGYLLDNICQHFLFQTSVHLEAGRWYSIDFRNMDATTIYVTRAWGISDLAHLP
jgi:hypothetical protein